MLLARARRGWSAAPRGDLKQRVGRLACAASSESLTSTVKLADTRYRAGATSYLDVIDAQRSVLTIQRLDTQIKGARATSTVALIRALGGGWNVPAPVAAAR